MKKQDLYVLGALAGLAIGGICGGFHVYKKSLISDLIAVGKTECMETFSYTSVGRNMTWVDRAEYCECILKKTYSDLSISELQDIRDGFGGVYILDKVMYNGQKHIGSCVRKTKGF